MDTSLFLAQLIGLSLALFALIALLRPAVVSNAIHALRDTSPLTELLFGFAGIVVGLSIVLTHNIWEGDWRVFITLVGWAALIKGVFFLYSPSTLLSFGKSIYKNPSRIRLVLLIGLVVGLYIAYKGFGN